MHVQQYEVHGCQPLPHMYVSESGNPTTKDYTDDIVGLYFCHGYLAQHRPLFHEKCIVV